MNDHLNPVEIIYGIDNMQGGGASDVEVIQFLARLAEGTARKVIKNAGFAPDLKTYFYVPNDSLSPEEIRKERLEHESQAWHNEASHLIGIQDPVLEAAALTIIEAGRLSYFLDTGQPEKAIISMANLLACGLLHSDQDNEGAISVLRNRHKIQSSKGGSNKRGYESSIKKYVKKACENLKLDNLDIERAARKIFKQFEDDNGCLVYQSVYPDYENCPIVSIEYDQQKQILSYHAIDTPTKKETLKFDRLKDIVRELRKS